MAQPNKQKETKKQDDKKSIVKKEATLSSIDIEKLENFFTDNKQIKEDCLITELNYITKNESVVDDPKEIDSEPTLSSTDIENIKSESECPEIEFEQFTRDLKEHGGFIYIDNRK